MGINVFSGKRYKNVEVYDGALPTSGYTDLDLSSFIGTGRFMVTLKLAPSVDSSVAFRTNGETAEVGFLASSFFGCGKSAATISGSTSKICYIEVLTDENSIVEWKSTDAGNCVVTLETYERVV